MKKKKMAPAKEAILKEEIARSYYPDHFALEFAKEYFGKIKFYWSFGVSKEWEGEIGWEKISGK